jgi:mono/diheme cytochrome c family protein
MAWAKIASARIASARIARVIMLAMSLLACQAPERPADTDSRSGADLFRNSCAACHGEDARGSGPVAPLLTVEVPDLTRIAARRHGEFPELEVFRIIDGQSELAAHGPRHMPVWGYEFFGDDADDEAAHRRAVEKVDRLVGYLRTIQRD